MAFTPLVYGNLIMKVTVPLQIANQIASFGFSLMSLIMGIGVYPSIAQAPNPQGNPNQDRFPQSLPTLAPLPPESESQIKPIPTLESTDAADDQRIQVAKIEVLGSTLFDLATLNPIIQPLEGRAVTFKQLKKAADAITQLYLNQGYITSRAVLVDQKVTDGIIKIQVVEGGLEKIKIIGTKRLNPDYVRSRIALGAGKPLSTTKLEEQLKILRIDPLIANLEASIQPGNGLGQSVLIVRVTEAKAFNGNLSIDNYFPPSIGSERLGITANHRNLTGRGDELGISYYFSTRGSANIYDFTYKIPLNAMNGTLQLRSSINNNQVIDPKFKALNISGESELYEVSYRQPLVRSLREEFALSFSFSYQDGQTFTFAGPTPFGSGPDRQGNSRTRIFKIGQDYVRRDIKGYWAMRSLFSLGADIFNATIQPDPTPDGRFFSWLGQVQRVQNLSPDHLLIAQAEVQLSANALLGSQQYIIGGGQSVRGYRQNARSGDNGIKFSLEDRITLHRDASGNPMLQFTPFVDLGYIWNVDNNPNSLQPQHFLAGTGVGILFQPIPNLNLRIDYGVPLVNLKDKGTNAQDDGLYFSINYRL
ncbi:MAG: ShlB/FhaC/HecB family hemolysin secretion/activation protein [Cuspidothrix sp.]